MAVKTTVAAKGVTYDIARQADGAKEVKRYAYAEAVIANLG